MNIIESWKKQVTFLQNKDSRTVFYIALKRYIHVLSTEKFLCFWLLLLTFRLFSHRTHNISDLSLFGTIKTINGIISPMLFSFAFFSIVLFLRPSTQKKDNHYLGEIIKKKEFMIIFFALCCSIIPIIFIFPFLFITSTVLLLSVDGEYGIKDIIGNIKKVGLFLIYNLPTLAIVSCIDVASLIFFQYITALYMQDAVLKTIALLASALSFSLIILFTIFIFVFVYTVSIYENDRVFFDL